MDSDKMLVIDADRAAEFASPSELLSTPNSMFASLVDQTGKNNSAHLRNIATMKHSASSKVALSELEDTPGGSSSDLKRMDDSD